MNTTTIEQTERTFDSLDQITPEDVAWLLHGTKHNGHSYTNQRLITYTTARGITKSVRGFRFESGQTEGRAFTLRNTYQTLTLDEQRIFDPAAYEHHMQARKRLDDENRNGEPLKAGDILADYYGYDATIWAFYQVTRVSPSGKTVWVRELQQETRPMEGVPCGWHCRPKPGVFASGESSHRVQYRNGKPYIHVGYSTFPSPCDPNKWYDADDYH